VSITRAEAVAELVLARRVCVRLLETTVAASRGDDVSERGAGVVDALAEWAVHTGRDGEAAARASGEVAGEAMTAAYHRPTR
jgi:hypothetical protein